MIPTTVLEKIAKTEKLSFAEQNIVNIHNKKVKVKSKKTLAYEKNGHLN